MSYSLTSPGRRSQHLAVKHLRADRGVEGRKEKTGGNLPPVFGQVKLVPRRVPGLKKSGQWPAWRGNAVAESDMDVFEYAWE